MSNYGVSPVFSSLNNNNSNSKTDSSDDNNTLGQEAFLKLLLAEFQHQDPLNPMDGTEYVSQLAQLTSLEKLQNINDNMDTMNKCFAYQLAYLKEMLKYQTLYKGSSLIGKTVEINDGEFTGKVSKVSFKDGKTCIYIDGKEHSIDDITAVYEAA